MIGARARITGKLRVLSPLHVGSGRKGSMATDDSLEASSAEFTLGLVLRDGRGLPYIPGSSLKGVLRRLSTDPEVLFGPKSGSETFASGKLIFRTALHSASAGVQYRIPYGDAKQQESGQTYRAVDLFVESQTAVDDKKGVAERSRLFHNEQVLPGTEFDLCLTLAATAGKSAEQDLAAILARLCTDDGVGFGKNTRQGKGRIRLLLDTVAEESFPLAGSGKKTGTIWREKIAAASAPPLSGWNCTLTLRCDGPFLIADRSPRPPAPPGEAPQITGLSDFANDAPRLTGASLLGALRARFAWEQALRTGDGSDNSDKTFTTIETLTTTERLFGVTGWRGRVSLGAITLASTSVKQKIMSVSLDRFSAAPIDNALFGTEAWIDPVFHLRLTLEDRKGLTAGERDLLAGDDKLFKDFLERLGDPVWGGLSLGMGENKGYGVFALEVSHG